MNKKVLIILALTIIAIVVLALYSFGPLAGTRTSIRPNPDSLKPTGTEKVSLPASTGSTFTAYTNKDRTENFYTIKFPASWSVSAAKNPGGYSLQFPSGDGTAELMDVPDNSTLELYVLSQEEPKLKKSLSGYQRIDYKKLTLSGHEAYQLMFEQTVSGEKMQTIRIYTAGQDMANVITLSARAPDFQALQPSFDAVIQSFRWSNP